MNVPFLSCFILVVTWVSAPATEKFSFSRPLMGTRFSVVCYAETREVAEVAVNLAFAKAEEVNAVASDYLPDSELSLLSSKGVVVPISLSPLLGDLLSVSRQMAELTEGAFDPTLGPMTKLWRETRKRGRLPDQCRLDAARTASGWEKFSLDEKKRNVILHQENMRFDLGGIAKGYAADLMLQSLAESGIPQALVTAGGDVRMGAAPEGREGWNVAIKTFDAGRNEEVLTLANAAVSTSGDLHQSVEIEGVVYSHILDPDTGLGLKQRVAATVIADNASLSDSIATAACVRGEKGAELLRKLEGVRAVRVWTP